MGGRRVTRVSADPRRGAALLIVLMFSALLSALAGAAMRTAVSGARAASVFADAARADALGAAAGDIVIHEMMTGDPETRRGGSLAARVADAEITIDYVSESARIDVNTGEVGLIAAVLTAAGADPSLVSSVADHVTRLRAAPPPDRAAVTAPADAEAATIPNVPARTAPAQPVSVLQIVGDWKLPEDLLRRLLPVLTVSSGSKGVDPTLADRLVVAALMGGDDGRVDDYVERRTQGFVNADSALDLLPIPSRAFASFEESHAVHAIAHVTVARRFERRYDMVIASPAGSAAVPVLINWRKLL